MAIGAKVRADGRTADQMRPLKITPDFISPPPWMTACPDF
jgi:exosome complex RNA-binding protein Rrp42 (RNase PH superfamily)